MAYFGEAGGVFTLRVRVTPKSASNEVTGLVSTPGGDAALAVRVTAIPDKGAANEAVIATLAKALRLPKSAFSFLSGETGRVKTLRLQTHKAGIGEIRQRLEDLVS